jgi:pyridoxine 4-dehydrogenase
LCRSVVSRWICRVSSVLVLTLAWLLARSPAILPIPATTSINHLQENLDAQDLDLIPEDIKSIDSLVPENAAA